MKQVEVQINIIKQFLMMCKKIVMVDEEFFQTEYCAERYEAGWDQEKYTIDRYEFTHMPKDKCEKRKKLINETHKAENVQRKKDLSLVRQIEAIDDELGIGYHDGKYGEQPNG